MLSVAAALERARTRGLLPPRGEVALRDLARRVPHQPRGSVRALASTLLRDGAAQRPFAVILCRFRGDPPAAREAPVETFFREAFTAGTGGLVEYWREVSLGAIDISGSRVFGWVEITIPRSGAGGRPRGQLIDAAVTAAFNQARVDTAADFFRPIAVFTRDWASDGPPQAGWIDGSADGDGRISAPPHGHSGNFLAHEMGHSLGMGHDVGPGLTTASDYADPCCIMSQQNAFVHPRWGNAFGPALCLPHLILQGWIPPRRVFTADGDWMDSRAGLTVPLAPVARPLARANLGLVLPLRPRLDWDYQLEFVIPDNWTRGLPQPTLFVRRLVTVGDEQARPAFLAQLAVPTGTGQQASVVETSGNTRFTVELTGLQPGPVLKVTAQKL